MTLREKLKNWQITLLYGLWRVGLILVAGSVFVVLVMRWLPPPSTSFVFQDQVRSWLNGKPKAVHYRWVNFESISPHVALAVIASEDQRFAQHAGFDFDAIQSAVSEKLHGGRLRGASTISQQVAKNLFLWRTQSFVRKGVEAYFTLLIELLWNKRRILEVYLNTSEFGPGIYGVGAASRHYFHKKPAQIGPRQAALLAAVLPNPKRLHVQQPSGYLRFRQNHILRQMRQLGGQKYMDML